MPLIEVIQPKNATGELKDIYSSLEKSRGKLAEVHKIQSLNPKSIMNHMDLYMTIMFGKSPLKRYQREMIAVVVSLSNNCEYCQKHHSEALNHFWKNDKKLEQFKSDFYSVSLSEIDLKYCEYAKSLTQTPSKDTSEIIGELKKLGVNDKAILDSTLVISYFNFVNRIVLGLKVNLEEDSGAGYKYD